MTEEETKLKVNLEDVVILSESIAKIAQEVYNLHLKIVNEKANKKKQKMIVINGKEKLPEDCHFCEHRYMSIGGNHTCGICQAIIDYNVNSETKYNKCPLKECK